MSYRTILVPVGQADSAQSAIETAFLVAKRFEAVLGTTFSFDPPSGKRLGKALNAIGP